MIKILGYGLGNVGAIQTIYEKLSIPCEIASGPDELRGATHLVLPGVGAFDEAIRMLNASGMRDALDDMVLGQAIPVLGICVGMQIMATSGEEGTQLGLDWIPGVVERIDSKTLSKPKLPHMGWNAIVRHRVWELLRGVDDERGFYFLHSYHFRCNNDTHSVASAHYGGAITCGVSAGNIHGMQFHPEKSHSNGVAVFRNFAQL